MNMFLRKAKIILPVISLLPFCTTRAQMHVQGNLHIANNATMYVAGNVSFSTSGSTTTTRTVPTHGTLSIGASSGFSGASASHYVDGYITVFGTQQKTLPLGQSGHYVPCGVTPFSGSGVTAAYYRQNPLTTLGTAYDTEVVSVQSSQYWHITGAANTTMLTLSWNSGDLASLSGVVSQDLSEITITGWNGAKWQVIPSAVDAVALTGGSSSLTAGSVTTAGYVDLATYRYFAIGVKEGCAPMVASSGSTKTWNGTAWMPSTPLINDPVVLNAPYTQSLQCYSLTLNADITLEDNEYLEVVNDVTGSGKVYMSGTAALVQRNPSAATPTVVVHKTTRAIKRNEYVYWGTPIAGDFKSQIDAANAVGYTQPNAFDVYYKWVPGATGTGYGWQSMTATETGKGFMARVKNQIPYTDAAYAGPIEATLSGTANNGTVSVPVSNNANCANCGSSYNLLANPYPSAIDAAKFLKQNTGIDGVIYIWAKSATGVNTQADYAVWNLAGSVNTSPLSFGIDGQVPMAQGFMVKALQPGTVSFTNCMRIVNDNNVFFRMTDVASVANTFKLNMYNNADVFSQILIAYMPEATLGYDRLYDAGRNSVSTAQLYSVFEGDGRKLAINSRPDFVVTDEVPLGISKSNTTEESFTISLSENLGIFADGSVNIYLYDMQEGIYHNMESGPYTFTVASTALNQRFKIVYQAGNLGTATPANTAATVYASHNVLTATAATPIKTIDVFDMAGRLIQQYNAGNTTNVSVPFQHAQAVYIARVTLQNGTVSAVKLVHLN